MEILKQTRIKENFTFKEMAEKIGISESLYQKLEYGVRTPSIKVIHKLKKIYPDLDTNIFFDQQLHEM